MPYTFIMYLRQEKLVPSMTWDVIEFFKNHLGFTAEVIRSSRFYGKLILLME